MFPVDAGVDAARRRQVRVTIDAIVASLRREGLMLLNDDDVREWRAAELEKIDVWLATLDAPIH